MEISISNIAWDFKDDNEIFLLMNKYGYTGLEIAPTRIINTHEPYTKENTNKAFNILCNTGFKIPSAQSILYGRNEKLFGSIEEREALLNYLYKAVDYAAVINCNNLVFGSPKNRIINDFTMEYQIAVDFFNKLGDYAAKKNITVAIEPNPVIYGTNFINDTISAYKFIKDIGNKNIKINYDIGTVIENKENINDIEKYFDEINHIHISEPHLEIIQKRDIHVTLFDILKANDYKNFISIEMKKQENIANIENVLQYISELNYGSR